MKKILSINLANYSSTGSIMINISKTAENSGYMTYVACSGHKENLKHRIPGQIIIGSKLERNLEILTDKLTGLDSCVYPVGTKLFVKRIKKIKPDLIHLHNLHGGFINIKVLFPELRKMGVPIIWTLHDCWSFTGHCPYFDMVRCEKWTTGCHDCTNMGVYPKIYSDRTKYMWNLKRELFRPKGDCPWRTDAAA